MAFELRAVDAISADVETIGVGYFAGLESDGENGIAVDAEFLANRNFEGKAGQLQAMRVDGKNVIAIGLGERGSVTNDSYRRAAAQFVRACAKNTRVAIALSGDARAVAEGLVLGSYKFTKYKSKPEPTAIEVVEVVTSDSEGVEWGGIMGDAVSMARDLVNEPAGALTPTQLANAAESLATSIGLRVEVWDEARIVEECLGGLAGVAQGSDQEPRLIKLYYEPAGATKTIALVGKGITFDSGGLSLKSGDGMMTMKTDMSGAAAVIAAMSVLPAMQPNVRVIGIAAVTENLPGPSAVKPGDVLQARNGKTMEVLNTDAEGRLVLSDALSLAVEEQADAIIDLATLTGACKVALGNDIAGLFGNDEAFVERVKQAAKEVDEKVWELPLHKGYRKLIDSDVADIKNIGSAGGAGATTAALFLAEFVDDKPWVHLDIAGPARADSEDAYTTKGGTGFGVRTLVQLVYDFATVN